MSFNSSASKCSGVSGDVNVGLSLVLFRSLSKATIIMRKGSL